MTSDLGTSTSRWGSSARGVGVVVGGARRVDTVREGPPVAERIFSNLKQTVN